MQPVYINRIASINAQGIVGENHSLVADEPDYKSLITNANLRRRMSRIIKMGVACGLECIGTTPPEQVNAIVTATGLGCLADTEKFMNNLLDQDEQMLNPTAFIQSTFNTIGAQIALLLHIHAYNVTYVHRGLSFESALLDGMMKIWEGNETVLVGAVDELTASSRLIQQRLGLLTDTIPGEGAQFFLLSSHKSEETFAQIKGVETFIHEASTQEVEERINSFLSQNELNNSDINRLITGRNGNTQRDLIYDHLEKRLFPHAKHGTFKEQCGEFQTATSYAVRMAAGALKEESQQVRNILIYNQYQGINHSLILLEKDL